MLLLIPKTDAAGVGVGAVLDALSADVRLVVSIELLMRLNCWLRGQRLEITEVQVLLLLIRLLIRSVRFDSGTD